MSKDKVVFAERDKDSYIINFTLDELQNRLNPNQFFRIHRSTIVNLEYLQTIEPLIGGTYIVTVNDQKKTQLQVSRSAGKVIKARFNW
jgi:DNA-binding LytR/AlgR family response regulator